MTPNSFTWFVTGTSSGFGEVLVKQILARANNVIATARTSPSSSILKKLVPLSSNSMSQHLKTSSTPKQRGARDLYRYRRSGE
jgi:short-subunit dehydrogenase